MKYLSDLDVAGKRVLVQANIDVPLQDGQITDDSRLRADLETYKYLLEKDCSIIIAGHIGRPDGKVIPELSTQIITGHLATLLNRPVSFCPHVVGDEALAYANNLRKGEVMVLENLRFDPGQKNSDPIFAQQIASLADVYVNNDYIDAHRSNALNTVVPQYIPSAMGFALKREWEKVRQAVDNPQRPLVLIIGGYKADKIGVINHLLGLADHIILGGVLANTFLKARGVDIGQSKYDERSLEIAGEFLRDAEEKFLLPVDVIAADRFDEHATHQEVSVDDIPSSYIIMDIGSHTIERYTSVIKDAKTIIWGGPIGVFEWPAFMRGTEQIARAVAEADAYSLIGGGDSSAAIHKLGMEDQVSHVSIGGGATLHLIAGDELPAIEALKKNS